MFKSKLMQNKNRKITKTNQKLNQIDFFICLDDFSHKSIDFRFVFETKLNYNTYTNIHIT